MGAITFAVDEKLSSDMESFSWVNWSEVARQELIKKAKLLDLLSRTESKKEKEFMEWAVKLVREGRKERVRELKGKGLV